MARNTSNILESASRDARLVRESAIRAAKQSLIAQLTPVIKQTVTKQLAEELNTGDDQPTGYDEDDEQKRLGDNEPVVGATGDDVRDEGDGPAIVEDEDLDLGDEDENDVMEDEDLDLDLGDDEEDVMEDEDLDLGDEDEDDLTSEEECDDEEDDVMEDEDLDLGDEEDEDDVIEIVDDEEDKDEENDVQMESAKRRIRKLAVENAKLKRGLKESHFTLRKVGKTLKDVNMLNVRLTAFNKLVNESSLTRKEKMKVMDRFDECQTVGEVKKVYRALKEAYNHVPVIRKKQNRIVRPVNKSELNESENNIFHRWQEMADLLD